jgi:hypothetical protein
VLKREAQFEEFTHTSMHMAQILDELRSAACPRFTVGRGREFSFMLGIYRSLTVCDKYNDMIREHELACVNFSSVCEPMCEACRV